METHVGHNDGRYPRYGGQQTKVLCYGPGKSHSSYTSLVRKAWVTEWNDDEGYWFLISEEADYYLDISKGHLPQRLKELVPGYSLIFGPYPTAATRKQELDSEIRRQWRGYNVLLSE